MGQKEQ